jgi:ribosomal protein S18 acetylase RimI-like enzyme
MQAEITVRRIRAEEWEWLRAIRLRALADAPMAFGSTLADEQARPDEFWRGRAAGGASDDDRATFIAERNGVWVGIGTCVLEAGGAGERPAWIFGMWVDPAVRRQGTAQALLRFLAGWARERGADVLNLHVTATNAPAIALYERLGFRTTGATEPLAHTPSVRENHMACSLEQFRSDGES